MNVWFITDLSHLNTKVYYPFSGLLILTKDKIFNNLVLIWMGFVNEDFENPFSPIYDCLTYDL